MTVQSRADQANLAFILSGNSLFRDNETILTDAARVAPLVFGTVMAKVSASGKWVPFTDPTAVDGTATARGVYIGPDITAAALVAGDVVGVPVLFGGCCTIDAQQLVIETGTLATVVGAATVNNHTVQDDLARFGIFVEDTIDIDAFEN
jgi:hypothetical protein